MPENTHLELVHEEAERRPDVCPIEAADRQALRSHATELARSLAWVPSLRSSDAVFERYRVVCDTIVSRRRAAERAMAKAG